MSDNFKEAPDGTIDLTPTWTGVLPIFMAALENGTDDAKAAARSELYRMAQLADRQVAAAKAEEGERS